MYGKLENNILKYAPHYIIHNNKMILNPQGEDYLTAGYKEIEFGIMPLVEGNKNIIETYSENESKIIVSYVLEDTQTTYTTDTQ